MVIEVKLSCIYLQLDTWGLSTISLPLIHGRHHLGAITDLCSSLALTSVLKQPTQETQEQDIPKTSPTTPKQGIFSQTHWHRSYFCRCLHHQNSCAKNLQATLKVKPPRIIASLNILIAPDYTYRSLPLSKAFNRCTNSWLAPQPAVTNKVGGFELRTWRRRSN